ncbi:unnamed protein product [Lepeophtheirus salmonis]|uniref:(salmon louse) hypothetical protein n=1 Tax=Lepeophtheirus salmonis TaxID=72036 RepID=A0A7R8D3N2_LEPSM|nr:unnamed protein product [Lepeophtheirus salmonis]CAF3017877.1 unnamed protein product [Lepeophtheirus salmonis]
MKDWSSQLIFTTDLKDQRNCFSFKRISRINGLKEIRRYNRRRYSRLVLQYYKNKGIVMKPSSKTNNGSNVNIRNGEVPLSLEYERPIRETNSHGKELQIYSTKLTHNININYIESLSILYNYTFIGESLITSNYVKDPFKNIRNNVDKIVDEDIPASSSMQSTEELSDDIVLSTVETLDLDLNKLVVVNEKLKEKKFDIMETNEACPVESYIVQDKDGSQHSEIFLSSGLVKLYDNNYLIPEEIFEDFVDDSEGVNQMDSFNEICQLRSTNESISNPGETMVLREKRDDNTVLSFGNESPIKQRIDSLCSDPIEYVYLNTGGKKVLHKKRDDQMALSFGNESPIKQRTDSLCSDSIECVSEGSHPQIKIESSIDIDKLYTTSRQLSMTKNQSSASSRNLLKSVSTEMSLRRKGTMLSIKDIPYVNEDYLNEGSSMEIKDLLDEVPSSLEVVDGLLKEDMRLHYADHYEIEISRNYTSYKDEAGNLICRICFKIIEQSSESRHYALDHDVIRLYVTKEIYDNFFTN